MNSVYVLGHQNPDTDSTTAAITYAYLAKEACKLNTKPILLGDINEETRFALDFFKINKPEIITNDKSNNIKKVILVDHNEFQQSISNIEMLDILQVIDHHRIANFKTSNPLFMRIEPIGSSCSIIFKMYKENNIEPSQQMAGLMLSGLISDTLLLKSPTTTEIDKILAQQLANIAKVNLQDYGIKMLKAGTNLSNKTVDQLINIDAKTFSLNNNNIRIAQINTIDIKDILKKQNQLEQSIKNTIQKNNYSDFILMITDIINSNSEILHIGENADKIEKAFNFKLINNHAFLKGAVSRKKQIIPKITEIFIK